MFRIVKNLKVVFEKWKEVEVKRQRRRERMQRRIWIKMATKLQDCSKKVQYFGTYHVERT
jgi:hypothetical protein